MRAIGVKETAAVGPQVFDELQRRHRPLWNDLLCHLDRLGDGVATRVGDRIAIAVRSGLLIAGRLHQRYDLVGLDVRGHTLPDEQQPAQEREGSSTQRVARVRSTQKLPRPVVRSRARPRMNAMPTASPAAPARKFCTARPTI